MSVALRDVDDVIDAYTGRSRIVLEYGRIVKGIVDAAKGPDYSRDSWAPLAELVDTERFVRVGNFKEVMDWEGYVDFLFAWAASADWECSFKRVTEVGDVVFLELEERAQVGDFSSVVNSLSVYEFDADDKIHHVDVYLQMALPGAEVLDTYEGIDITE